MNKNKIVVFNLLILTLVIFCLVICNSPVNSQSTCSSVSSFPQCSKIAESIKCPELYFSDCSLGVPKCCTLVFNPNSATLNDKICDQQPQCECNISRLFNNCTASSLIADLVTCSCKSPLPPTSPPPSLPSTPTTPITPVVPTYNCNPGLISCPDIYTKEGTCCQYGCCPSNPTQCKCPNSNQCIPNCSVQPAPLPPTTQPSTSSKQCTSNAYCNVGGYCNLNTGYCVNNPRGCVVGCSNDSQCFGGSVCTSNCCISSSTPITPTQPTSPTIAPVSPTNGFNEREPNNSPNTAQLIGIPATISGNVSTSDKGDITLNTDSGESLILSDLFKFVISKRTIFKAQLTIESNSNEDDLDLVLLDSKGRRIISSSSTPGNVSETITKTLRPGTYLLGVGAFTGSSSYRLSLSKR